MSANFARTAANTRVHARTNMFITGVLAGHEFSSAAKIRNMSPTGALVEATVVPDVDTTVRLVRGSLCAQGVVAWSEPGRCGIGFSSAVSVQEWLRPGANRAQQLVDRSVALLKAGAVPLDAPLQSSGLETSGAVALLASMVGDLKEISDLLANLGAGLIHDEEILTRHGTRLQNLDIAMQSLLVIRDAAATQGQIGTKLVDRLSNLRSSRREALDMSPS